MIVFADGACHAGIGAWAYLILSTENFGNAVKATFEGSEWYQLRRYSAERGTTNNVMELKALTRALKAIPQGIAVKAVLDSKYVITCAENGPKWRAAGWRNTSGVVKNIEYVSDLLDEVAKRSVEFIWVKGHTDGTSLYHRGNAAVDQMAQSARKAFV